MGVTGSSAYAIDLLKHNHYLPGRVSQEILCFLAFLTLLHLG